MDEELDSSELGTLQYWEERYNSEIRNFSQHGDTGEIWFGEDIVDRIINWITANIPKTHSIVDVGCGNGHILNELAHLGYTELTGIDYSEKGISLATAIAKRLDLRVDYHVEDVLQGLNGVYDVVHDKGTYDAISLSVDSKESCQKYLGSIKNSLKDGGHFIITSCNWTSEELVERFKCFFKLQEVVPTPQFKFGGKVGNVVSICVFQHNN